MTSASHMTFDRSADIVVVGFGCAGLAAAITAWRAGAETLVLEKQSPDAHTPSTRMSGGMMMATTDVEKATRYLDHCAGGMVPRDVSEAWAIRALGLIDWLHEIAPELDLCRVGGAEHPDFEGSDAFGVFQPGGAKTRLDLNGKAGPFLWEKLAVNFHDKTDVPVLWNSPADRLLRNDEGRIIGVETTDGRRIEARKGVILTCGGYLHNTQMKRDYLRAWPVYFYGNPGNTGDGVRMAQEVGADLWHMNQMIGRAIGNFELEDGKDLSVMLFLNPPGYVITDRYGKRFADESAQANLLHGFYYHLLAYNPETGETPRNPCYWFFDEKRRKAGMLTLPSVGVHAVGIYSWSEDNKAEIARGWIASGATIAEAASAAGVADPTAAEASIEAYNDACRTGAPDPFGRPTETMVPVDEGPFYCVRLYPGGSNTTGGPRRNARAQILDTRGQPIPGLYAAGELGQGTGMLYPSDGSNLSEGFCFGQIAAESALADAGARA
ncbi:FAD-dependent oxidoreductase [Microvirga sp. 2YAF29]|uniref:FAD-dependent oxidoreductase n=1 Tax=Microvirga sp. 2YAF29 TaxID=3233031 RepID=UPI003F9C0368